jgi:F0F1-type ATP synthase assembly protein I
VAQVTQPGFASRLSAIRRAVLTKPLRLLLMVVVAVVGVLVDRTFGFGGFPLGVIVIGFGANAALVARWVAREQART